MQIQLHFDWLNEIQRVVGLGDHEGSNLFVDIVVSDVDANVLKAE